MELEAGEPEIPNTPPQKVFWNARPDSPVSRGVTPSRLPSGIVTLAKGQVVVMAGAPEIPPAAVGRAVPTTVSIWKVSGDVAEFCVH